MNDNNVWPFDSHYPEKQNIFPPGWTYLRNLRQAVPDKGEDWIATTGEKITQEQQQPSHNPFPYPPSTWFPITSISRKQHQSLIPEDPEAFKSTQISKLPYPETKMVTPKAGKARPPNASPQTMSSGGMIAKKTPLEVVLPKLVPPPEGEQQNYFYKEPVGAKELRLGYGCRLQKKPS